MPEKPAEPHPLTFQWTHAGLRERGLLFWLVIVLLGAAAFFYVFQVAYPQSQRFTPVPQQVLMLTPADAKARAVLQKVQDRDFLIVPPTSAAAVAVELEEHAPVFHPSFEGHKMELQDLPHKSVRVPPARLLQMDAPVLPPLDLSELKAEPVPVVKASVVAPSLVMKLSGDLATWKVTAPPNLAGMDLADPGKCRFKLGVNADGQVEFVLPLQGKESPEVLQTLTQRLREVRFEPGGRASNKPAGPTWGQVSFEWSKGGEP